MNVPLGIDAEQIRIFANAMFRYASDGQFIALRTFDEVKGQRPIELHAVRINDGGIAAVADEAERMAGFAALHTKRAVFCPPIAGFSRDDKADEASLSEGYAISVECDARPAEARETLERLLGRATVIVASGGWWTDSATGEINPKLHLHWRTEAPRNWRWTRPVEGSAQTRDDTGRRRSVKHSRLTPDPLARERP